jgi:hypothetical protein
MKPSGIAIAGVVAIASFPCGLMVAQKRIAPKTAVSASEPFRTFRELDQKLTLLQTQQHFLQETLQTNESTHTTGAGERTWVAPAHAMRKTVISMQRLLRRPERLYRIRHRQFGVQLFGILRTRAETVRRNVVAVERERNRKAAYSKQQNLEKSILSLIVQFQAASGGYGAVRCPGKAWSCCEPKRAEDLQSGEQAACRWMCVQRSTSCSGFVGPRI